MEHTSNYELSKWAESDRILMEDFNMDHDKIDAALAGGIKLVTGSYVGTGTYGKQNPNTLTFNAKPIMVLISGPLTMIALQGSSNGALNGGASAAVSWQGNSISWYSVQSVINHLNDTGTTYYYAALLQADK